MEKTLFEYITEKYGYDNIVTNLTVHINDRLILSGSPKAFLKSFSFYDLQTTYVKNVRKNNFITVER